MSHAIGDKAAITFAAGFYKALGAGRSFIDAYKFACIEIQLEGISEHLTPVLYKRESVEDFSLHVAQTEAEYPEKEKTERLWKFLTLDLTGEVRQFTTSDQYYAILTEIVTKASCPCDLHVSIGEGDFLYAWLTRIYYETPPDAYPQIRKLIIKRLSDELIENFVAKEQLRESFKNKVNRNIAAIIEDDELRRNKIEVEVRYWSRFPEFHGYLCGNEMLVGKWQNNADGYLHVKTPLYYARKRFFPKEHSLVVSGFK